eukprot:TRINITY_DN9183_c0_g1_i2.p1 TRINITY_DN9183_c0_g1~~TRINITY_DN9183_c0_g1_i2.p1  ORF type:complete len:195 (+),score=35.93 TRINITY_DN9183_c0_g1_i2:80-664(+)
MQADQTYTLRPLFGGAMEASIPPRFLDLSDIRQTPDNQEVLVDGDSEQSVIVEILSLADEAPADQFASWHFQQLAEDNSATSSQILNTFNLTAEQAPLLFAGGRAIQAQIVIGQQTVSKFKEHAGNVVSIPLCVIRIPSVTTDILVSVNDPVVLHPQSSSVAHGAQVSHLGSGEALLAKIMQTFKIADWNLFGE